MRFGQVIISQDVLSCPDKHERNNPSIPTLSEELPLWFSPQERVSLCADGKRGCDDPVPKAQQNHPNVPHLAWTLISTQDWFQPYAYHLIGSTGTGRCCRGLGRLMPGQEGTPISHSNFSSSQPRTNPSTAQVPRATSQDNRF